MSEKTLKEVGEEATKLYKEHNDLTEEMQRSESHRINTRGKYVTNRIDGEEFANDNSEQLHDLAVIEAHLGGVAIKVEQLVEIGQKVEVHTPDHQ